MVYFIVNLLLGILVCKLNIKEDDDLSFIPMRTFVNAIQKYHLKKFGNDNYNIRATFAPNKEGKNHHRVITIDDFDEIVDFYYVNSLCQSFFLVPCNNGERPLWKNP